MRRSDGSRLVHSEEAAHSQEGWDLVVGLLETPPEYQYRSALQQVIEEGQWVPTRQGVRALTAMQVTMRFNLRESFPMITERDVGAFWRKPIGELAAFINGVTRVEELEKYGCDWWGPWAVQEKTADKGIEPGSLGPGSYGGAFHDFPSDEGGFDQFQHLVEQIRELPELRTHFVSPWIPSYQVRGAGKRPRTTIAPCHGWVHVRVINGSLSLHMFQRSGDFPVGVPSNLIQYAALAVMLANITGFERGSYFHTVSDAHIYENQLPHVEEMLRREARALPKIFLTESGSTVRDIHQMRGEHFVVRDYWPHPALWPPVAV